MTCFPELSKVATLKEAKVDEYSADFLSINSKWTVRDTTKSDENEIDKTFLYNLKDDKVISVMGSHGTSEKSRKLYNTKILWEVKNSNGLTYVCQQFKMTEKDPKLLKLTPEEATYISVYNKLDLVDTFKILDPTKKDKPFTRVLPFKSDPSCPFSSVQVSRDKKKILFSVEAVTEKASPFEFVETYGETLFENQIPTIAVFDMEKKEIVQVLKITDMTYGQATFTPDSKGMILVGHLVSSIKLGLSYCWQRVSSIIHYDFETEKMTNLSKCENSVRNPRFSPNGKLLVWLDMFVGGPHFQCQRLKCLKWEDIDLEKLEEKKDLVNLVPIIDYPLESGFPGIFNPMGLPFNCWTEDSRYVIFSTKWSFNHVPLLVNVEKCLKEQTENLESMKKSPAKAPLILPPCLGNETSSWMSENLLPQDISLIEVRGSLVIAKVTSLLHPHSIGIFRLPEVGQELTQEDLNKTKWNLLKSSETLENEIKGVEVKRFWTKSSLAMNLNDLNVWDFESSILKVGNETYFNSCKGQQKPKGLIMVIHGGPHSAFFHSWSGTLAAFLLEGYSLLMPNYRGSIGYGDASVRCLPGHVGNSDVNDCMDSLKACQALFDLSSVPVYLFGGSHGGFLTCHLAGRFSSYFKGALALNPVTELLGMAYSSDIPDWSFVESNVLQLVQEIDTDYNKEQKEQGLEQLTNTLQPRGQNWFQGQVVNKGKQFEILAKMSPLSYVNPGWSVPLYVFLGDSDLRVPNWQGKVFYQKVKACTKSSGVLTNIFMYPNQGHRLDGVIESLDIFNNCIDLFDRTQK